MNGGIILGVVINVAIFMYFFMKDSLEEEEKDYRCSECGMEI